MSGLAVGTLLAEWVVPVDWMKVRDFARAVRDDHAAEAVPPPTFPVVLNADFVERLVSEILPVDRSRTLHGEQEYEYRRPFRIGEQVRCRARILSDDSKEGRRGGRMRIIVVEIEMAEADGGAVIAWERQTVIETQGLETRA